MIIYDFYSNQTTASLFLLSCHSYLKASPLPVWPMEPYFRKTLYGRETSNFMIPLELCHESHIWCSSLWKITFRVKKSYFLFSNFVVIKVKHHLLLFETAQWTTSSGSTHVTSTNMAASSGRKADISVADISKTQQLTPKRRSRYGKILFSKLGVRSTARHTERLHSLIVSWIDVLFLISKSTSI